MNPGLPAVLQGMQIPPELMALYGVQQNKDLSAGVMSVPVLSIRGKVFRLKHQGQETDLIATNGFPMPYLDIIMLKASPRFSKIYYPSAFIEGSDDPPLCFSLDGITPDISAQQRQCATCAACPHNVWGSKTTQQGTQTKACADGRRIAIVPAGAPMNEQFGGAMLLRVPPASLADLAAYGNQLAAYNIPYFAVVTRLSFAQDKAYPKMQFQVVQQIDAAQNAAVQHWLNGAGQGGVQALLQSSETPSATPGQPPGQPASQASNVVPLVQPQPQFTPPPAQPAVNPFPMTNPAAPPAATPGMPAGFYPQAAPAAAPLTTAPPPNPFAPTPDMQAPQNPQTEQPARRTGKKNEAGPAAAAVNTDLTQVQTGQVSGPAPSTNGAAAPATVPVSAAPADLDDMLNKVLGS